MTAVAWIAVALGYVFGSLILAIAIGKRLHRHTIIGDQDRAAEMPYRNVRRIDTKITVPRRLG